GEHILLSNGTGRWLIPATQGFNYVNVQIGKERFSDEWVIIHLVSWYEPEESVWPQLCQSYMKWVVARCVPFIFQEEETMKTLSLAGDFNLVTLVAAPPKRGVGHYLNLAITFAIVMGVAFAGWYATS